MKTKEWLIIAAQIALIARVCDAMIFEMLGPSSNAPVAGVVFTGASGSDKKFSTAGNWTALPNSNDTVYIAVTNLNGVATTAGSPALLVNSVTVKDLRVCSQALYGQGCSYMKIRSNGCMRAFSVAAGNPDNAAFDGMLTLSAGGALTNLNLNSGALSIGGDLSGMYGRVVVEAGATVFQQSSVNICSNGTLVYLFGTNSVRALRTTRTDAGAANRLAGRVVVDLSGLNTPGSYTLIDSGSTNLVLQGALTDWLNTGGGAQSGEGSFRNCHFVVLGGNYARWTLRTADGNQDLVLDVGMLPVQALGRATPFYRNTQLQGHLVANGLNLTSLPDYLTHGCDLSFFSKGSPMEIPLVDRFSITRYLGGFAQDTSSKTNDLACTNSAGGIQYRWDLVPGRIQQYLTNGYSPEDVMIVLDNIPWDMAACYSEGNNGDKAPPRNWQEWGRFVKDLCIQLSLNYTNAAKIRFKMGTEYNSTNSFAGTQEDYFKYYDYAVSGIRSVFPDAYVMPAEIGGSFNQGNVSYYALIDHCMSGTNYATGQIGTPVCGFARSSHCLGAGEIDPRDRLTNAVWTFDCLVNRNAGLRREDLNFEIHQFHWQKNEFGADTAETGARGAAWAFVFLLGMQERGLLDASWHWSSLDRCNLPSGDLYLMTGEGWLYNLFDHLQNKNLYILNAPAGEPDGTFFNSMAAVDDHEIYLVTSSFNTNRTLQETNRVDISLPRAIKEIPPGAVIDQLLFDDEGSVHNKIREDLAADGNLLTVYADHPYTLGRVQEMATNRTAGWKMVETNWNRYEAATRDTLTFKNFDMADYSKTETDQVFHLWLRKTGMNVIRIRY
ncbi:MAG: hypothetical protein WC334_07640 [Kiritimatiellales bacterium]